MKTSVRSRDFSRFPVVVVGAGITGCTIAERVASELAPRRARTCLSAVGPARTFAPNVLLSGLAARHRLRCFETPVAQHDRTTGEVSIKKWKLLKAAARSFLQTIRFSFHRIPRETT